MKNNLYAVALLALALAGCGSDKGEGVAQPRATIQIAPSGAGHAYRGDQIVYDGLGNIITAAENFVTVTVSNEFGTPLKNAQVRLYHQGGVGIADITRSLQPEPYITNTDDFGNVYAYIYTPTYDNVGETATDFEAFSGSAYNNMTVTMSCTDTDTTTEFLCD